MLTARLSDVEGMKYLVSKKRELGFASKQKSHALNQVCNTMNGYNSNSVENCANYQCSTQR